MNSNKDYKKLYNKYKLKYLALKKKINIEEDNFNIADNMLSFLNSSEEFNQIGGTYMKHNDEYFNIQEKIPILTKATDVSDADAFDPTCITQPVITIPNNGMLEPINKYFLPKNSEEAQKYRNKCMFISIYQFLKLTKPFSDIINRDFDVFRGLLSNILRDKYYKQYEEWDETDDKDKEALKQISDLFKLDIRIWESKEKFLGITDKKLDTTMATAKIGDETRKEHPEIKVLIQPIAPVFRYGAGQEHVVNILYYPGHFELIVGGSIFGEVNKDSLKKWDELDLTSIQRGGKLDNDSSSATSNTSSENYKYEIESTENLNDYMNQFNELLNTKKKL
tara:strand:+ start:1893 stop:2900 length:1008 start_codon:yes stop_codon:yes gene_type:complete